MKKFLWSGSTTPTSQNESFELTKAYFNAFPDLNQTIEELVASGDKVAVRFMARGTHRGDFQGIPATGNKMELSGIDMLHIKDGKIIEERQDADSLGFMMRLGFELKPKEAEKKVTSRPIYPFGRKNHDRKADLRRIRKASDSET